MSRVVAEVAQDGRLGVGYERREWLILRQQRGGHWSRVVERRCGRRSGWWKLVVPPWDLTSLVCRCLSPVAPQYCQPSSPFHVECSASATSLCHLAPHSLPLPALPAPPPAPSPARPSPSPPPGACTHFPSSTTSMTSVPLPPSRASLLTRRPSAGPRAAHLGPDHGAPPEKASPGLRERPQRGRVVVRPGALVEGPDQAPARAQV